MKKSTKQDWSSDFASKLYGQRTATVLRKLSDTKPTPHIRQILNSRPDSIDQRDFFYPPSLVEIPARYFNSVSAREDFSVRDQGNVGSCVGQAIAAAIDLQNLLRLDDKADVPNRISASYLYENARLYDHHPDDSLPGSSLRGAIKGFYHNGACSSEIAKQEAPGSTFRANDKMRNEARKVSLGTYFRLQHVLDHYHCALAETGSILCSALVHEGWSTKSVSLKNSLNQSVGQIKYPRIKNRGKIKPCKLMGGHAFVIVGYDATGFLVLNSWGEQWGNYPVAELITDYKLLCGEPNLPGIAHWSYKDWSDNVLDAWILRLTAPTGQGSGFIGGRSRRKNSNEKRSGAARKCDVQGHYMHVRDGFLVSEPPYENDFENFKEIAKAIRNNPDIHSLVFFAHGGLSTLDAASSRAAAMIPIYMANGIYPIFFFWRTGFGEMLGSILEGIAPAVMQRTQDYVEMKDASIERLAKPIGRAIWNDVMRNADACFTTNQQSPCEIPENKPDKKAWDATLHLIESCTKKTTKGKTPFKIHFIAHSAGVFMIGELFKRLLPLLSGKKNKLSTDNLGTISLLAPCCRSSYFNEYILPVAKLMGEQEMTVFNLNESDETSPDPAMLPYGKSLASLVSNSFYDERPATIVARDEFWQENVVPQIEKLGLSQRIDYILSGDKFRNGAFKSKASYHGEFDNDADTMNYILKKMIGQERAKNFKPELSGFTDEQLNRGGF